VRVQGEARRGFRTAGVRRGRKKEGEDGALQVGTAGERERKEGERARAGRESGADMRAREAVREREEVERAGCWAGEKGGSGAAHAGENRGKKGEGPREEMGQGKRSP
jgi:hypothetical protein